MFSNLSRWCRFLTDRLNVCSFYTGCDRVDFVDSLSHLGHIISFFELDDVSVVITNNNNNKNDFLTKDEVLNENE